MLTSASGAFTKAVGAISHVIPAHDGGDATLALVNIAFQNSEEYTGTLTAVSGSTVTDGSASWAVNDYQLLDPDGVSTYFMEVTSGTYEGLLLSIASNTSTVLTLTEDVSYLSVGDTYKIRKFFTLADVFSADNSEYSLRSGGNPAISDVVFVVSSSGEFERYFYQTAPPFAGGNGWRKAGDTNTDYSTKAIPANVVLIARNGPSAGAAINLITYGSVKYGSQRTAVFDGFNLTGYSFPVDTTLGTSGIDPVDLVSGGNANLSDVFYLLNDVTGDLDRYYYQTAPPFAGGNGWRVSGDTSTDQSGKTIKAGEGFLVLRRSSPGFDWLDDQPF